jgi:hypothetical protein
MGVEWSLPIGLVERRTIGMGYGGTLSLRVGKCPCHVLNFGRENNTHFGQCRGDRFSNQGRRLHLWMVVDAPPNSSINSTMSPKVKISERGVGVHFLIHNISWVEGRIGALRWRLRRMTSGSIIHTNLHKPNNKLISAWLEHFWCMNEPWTYINSQDSPRPKFGESYHLPPLYYSLWLATRVTSKCHFILGLPSWESRNSQNWNSRNYGRT